MTKKIEWTKDKLWELQKMYEDPDCSLQEMAECFGVSKNAINAVAWRNLMIRGSYADEGYKKCSKCGCVLEASKKNFYACTKNKSGLHSWCKECDREAKGITKRALTKFQKEYIIKNYANPSVDIEAMAQYLGITKKQVISYTKNARQRGIYIGYRINREYKKEVV